MLTLSKTAMTIVKTFQTIFKTLCYSKSNSVDLKLLLHHFNITPVMLFTTTYYGAFIFSRTFYFVSLGVVSYR